MSFLNKISNIFAKNKDISKTLEFKAEFKEEHILLTPNQDINQIENIIDLINIYNIETRMDSILVSYNDLYDLYYNENDEKIGDYKYFNLPDLFEGFINIENDNYLASNDVKYRFSFEDSKGKYTLKSGSALKLDLENKYKVMPRNMFNLVESLKEYNSNEAYRKDEAYQFEMVKLIKDYSKEIDIILNDTLRKEEPPVVIDKIKIDFEDNGETLEVFPKLSEVKETNDKLIHNINQYDNSKGIYSSKDRNGKKTRYVIKHKDTLETILEKKSLKGKDRLDVLSGKSSLFEDENIDISDFGPRVTGIGYLSYKSSSSPVNTNDLNWLDNNLDSPFIQGTNVNGDYENITLKPEDKLKLQMKYATLENNNEDVAEVEFISDDGNEIKVIMTKEDIAEEIKNISSRLKYPNDINKIGDLEKIIKLSDEYDENDYIPYKGMYIIKNNDDIKSQLNNRLDEIRENQKVDESSKKKTLLIAENIEDEDYKEIDEVKTKKHIVEDTNLLKKGINLFEYQRECLGRLQSLYLDSNINGFLLCDDMGLGKTLQLLSFLGWLKEKNEIKPSLVVAPTSLLNNWDSEGNGEIQKFFKEGAFNTTKVKGRITPDRLKELEEHDIVFITYESLRSNSMMLGKINWKVMICDEAQKIKTPKTMVTIAAKAQNANFKIICSATPIENSLEDLWTLTDYSKPGLLGSLKEFKNKYTNNSKNESYDDLKELNDKLYSKIEEFYIRREKDILPKSLPKKRIKLYKVKPTSTEVEVLEQIKDTEEHTLSAIQKMLAVCSHVDTLHMRDTSMIDVEQSIEKSSKLKVLKEILTNIKTKDEKVIIFTRLRSVQQILYKCIKKWFNVDVFVVNGEITNLDKRTNIINDFRKVSGFSVIILSPEVAGFGITLTEANHVIHYSRLWNPAKEDQATDRAYRIGQDKDVTVHYPIISFEESNTYTYDNVNDYVEENMTRKEELYLSPEEKLNILLSRKKNMLLNFFLAAGNGDISAKDFLGIDSDNDKKSITIDHIDKNILNSREMEGLISVLYSNLGYDTYINNTISKGVICKKDKEILYVRYIDTNKDLDTVKEELIYSLKKYKEYISGYEQKAVIVCNYDNIEDKSDIIISRDKFSKLLEENLIYKKEINGRLEYTYSFEEIVDVFNGKLF
ncbi:MAG: DEAD/DEAH box helicase [Romboutsia sp.]